MRQARRSWLVRAIPLAVAITLVTALVAAPQALLRAAPAQGPTLRIQLQNDPGALDPNRTTIVTAYFVLHSILSALVRFKPGTTELVPDLATSWEISPDGRTYTFTLRRGVRWQKGFGEFTADDVKFTYDQILDPQVGSVWRAEFDGLERVEVVDRYKVRFTLKEPNAFFLYKVSSFRSGFIKSRAAVKALGEGYSQAPVGTGPFVFESWIRNQQITLLANPGYFGGAPKVSRVTFVIIPDPVASQLALERGQIDIMFWLTARVHGALRANPNITITKVPSLGYHALGFNQAVKPFDDRRVRQAVAHAINVDALIANVLEGLGDKAVGPLAPGMFGYTADVPKYEYNPAKARALLAEAGITTPIRVPFLSISLFPFNELIVPIQADLARVGIQLDIRAMDAATLLSTLRRGEAVMAWVPLGPRPEPDSLLYTWYHSRATSPAGFNFMRYRGVDDLLDRGRVELNVRQRAAIYNQIQRKIMEDAVIVPLYHIAGTVTLGAHQKYVKGFVHPMVQDLLLNTVSVER
jgi:ABC-type transport system substrate-binding protein